jgi:LamB/YcsF family protein
MRAGVSKDHTVAAQFAAARHRADPDGLRERSRYELGAWSDRFYNSARLCHLVHSTVTETLMILLNCDMGESFGIWRLSIHIANVACSFHASDFNHMRTTVQLAKKHNVRVKTHPSTDRVSGGGRPEATSWLGRALPDPPLRGACHPALLR